ncbi:unnamed protein product, partial [Discosporangium mesarthrocarpum]
MRFNFLAALLAFAVVSVSTGFVAPPTTLRSSQMAMRASSFTSSISPATRGPYAAVSRQRPVRGDLRMGKVSTFGIFSPAVVAAKIVLGETRLNKIRGKVMLVFATRWTFFEKTHLGSWSVNPSNSIRLSVSSLRLCPEISSYLLPTCHVDVDGWCVGSEISLSLDTFKRSRFSSVPHS